MEKNTDGTRRAAPVTAGAAALEGAVRNIGAVAAHGDSLKFGDRAPDRDNPGIHGSSSRQKLQECVDRAELLMQTRGVFFTDGAQLAIRDMVREARLALEGTERLPFVRSRKFYEPREEEAVKFALKRYTMAPSFRPDGEIYNDYGLEPALEWFEKQDMMAGGPDKLQERTKRVLLLSEELLSGAVTDVRTGCYDETAHMKLKEAVVQVKTAQESAAAPGDTGEEWAKAIVRCYNAVREFRFSRVLRTEVDPEATLYLTAEGLERMKQHVRTDPLLKEQYEQIARIADRHTLEQLDKAAWLLEEDPDYSLINKDFYVWSTTDKIANFTAPDRAVRATLSFILPSGSNESDGLGHVWIDDLRISSASGGSLEITNSGFDEGDTLPYYWSADVRRGQPVLKWEGEYPYCGGGELFTAEGANPSSQVIFDSNEGVARHSLYICNPTGEDEGAWTYGGEILVQGGAGYTLTFAAKLDGKLKEGLRTVLTFLDEEGRDMGTFEYSFNRKSSLPNSCFLLPMQCDAIQYAFTGEEAYALKVKKEILYTLHDFCQGAEHWLVTQARPDGSDSFGAVQGGRVLCSVAVSYSFIKRAGVFSDGEKKSFYAMVEYMLRYMLDLRDRTELTDEEAQSGSGNWQTDMCAGAVYMMLVLEDFPNRKTWLYNGNKVLRSQLLLNVNPDSSWPESIRYHHAALERLAGYAKVLENVTGDNWFMTTPLAAMFGYSLQMQTPGYAYFGGRIGTPPFGDHALGGGTEFGIFGVYLHDVEKVDKELADRMYHTWVLAGKPFKKLWGEAITLDNLLGKGEGYVPQAPLALQSTKDYPHAGIYVFRQHVGTDRQSYFAIMSSPEPVAHGHLDQGSFVIYKNSVPIVMDSGIEGYFDSSTSWHISSYSHACVQFATKQTVIPKQGSGAINLSAGTYSLERGWVDVPRTSRVLECTLGSDVDMISIEIANPEGSGRHIRQVWYIKEPDLYIIRDTVEDFQGEVLFSLPVASVTSVVEGSRVYSSGAYDVELETVFLSKVKEIRLEKGRSTPFYDSGNGGSCMMDYIRATADAAEGFLTVLYPKEKGRGNLRAVYDAYEDGGLLKLAIDGRVFEWPIV
jgi:hypothetical protein